jgi:hypothetical protein
MALWGLVIFQQVNATNGYAVADSWLARVTPFGPYPNPIDYLGIIAVVALATAGVAWVASRLAMRPLAAHATASEGSPIATRRAFVDRQSRFRSYFVPVAYGLIPVVGADYLARQLPKFFKHALRIVPAVGAWFGVGGGTHSSLYHTQILSDPQIVVAQVVVIALGMAASLWATWRISRRDVEPLASHPLAARLSALGLVLACGASAGFLYVIMHAAS